MTQQPEAERIRSYVLAQANKLTIPDLVAKVRADTAPLRDAAAAIPAARFFERPQAEDWSAAEVFTHILEMNEAGAAAIASVLETGALPGTVQDVMSGHSREGLRTADDYWQAYQRGREPLLDRVVQADGDEHLDAKITHPTFGPFSWREWLLFMRVHDLDHMRQLQAIAAAFAR